MRGLTKLYGEGTTDKQTSQLYERIGQGANSLKIKTMGSCLDTKKMWLTPISLLVIILLFGLDLKLVIMIQALTLGCQVYLDQFP